MCSLQDSLDKLHERIELAFTNADSNDYRYRLYKKPQEEE